MTLRATPHMTILPLTRRSLRCSDELVHRDAGNGLDVAEVEEQLPPAQLVHEAEQVVADHGDVLLVQDFLVHELHDGDVADVFDGDPLTAGGFGHDRSSRDAARRAVEKC